jgi:ribosomal protein S18 acetylase RimI-like enzyme
VVREPSIDPSTPPASISITTETSRIPLDTALALLHTTNWAATMSRDVLERAMRHSLCFGVLDGAALVGFARVVTDRATYAYLTDVVIAVDRRGQGLGRLLMEHILRHPDLQGLRRFSLMTSDAMKLYEGFGFVTDLGRLTYMERR